MKDFEFSPSHNFIINYNSYKSNRYIPGYYKDGFGNFNLIHLLKNGIVEYNSHLNNEVYFILRSSESRYYYMFPVNKSEIKEEDRAIMKATRFGKIIKQCIKDKTFRVF